MRAKIMYFLRNNKVLTLLLTLFYLPLYSLCRRFFGVQENKKVERRFRKGKRVLSEIVSEVKEATKPKPDTLEMKINKQIKTLRRERKQYFVRRFVIL